MQVLYQQYKFKYTKPSGSIPVNARSKWSKKLVWKAFTPESFEWLVAQYFTIDGYENIIINQLSRDDGIDLILDSDRRKIAVEVKRYKPDNKVGAPVIRRAVGAANQKGIDTVIVVTTSSYTQPAKDARDEFKSNGNDIRLINGEEFVDNLNKMNLSPPWPPSKNK